MSINPISNGLDKTHWFVYLSPAHGASPFSVEPGGDALLAEDVFAVQDGRLLQTVVTNRTRTSTSLYLLQAWTSTVSLQNETHLKTYFEGCTKER